MIIGQDFGHSFMRSKSVDGVVCTLNADGSYTVWRGPRSEAQVLYLEGTDEQIARWLTETRNRHLHMTLATGWHLRFNFVELPDRPQAYHGIVWWEDDVESRERILAYDLEHNTSYADLVFYGPLMDLGQAFLRWKRYIVAWRMKKAAEQDVVMAMEAHAHAELTAEEDALAFADLERAMEAHP